MGRHGHASIPFGIHKGIRVRLLPDPYLSWLTTTFIMTAPEWRWLKDSVLSELNFRGLRSDLVDLHVKPGCQAVVPPYWNTLLECTSETCNRPLPCTIHTVEESAQTRFEFAEAKFLLESKRRIRVEGERT
jgi:hypothetical protein